jgi:hypothetical protein
MALPNAINDREFQKFVDVAPGETAVRVVLSDAISGFVPSGYDGVYATYPSATEEVYEFRNGATTLGFVTVTYSDSTKENLLSAVRT